MCLSSSYSTSAQYFHDTFQFLNEFDWIYKSSNTQFVANGILDQIPSEWIDSLSKLTNQEFNELPFDGFDVRNECQARQTFGIKNP